MPLPYHDPKTLSTTLHRNGNTLYRNKPNGLKGRQRPYEPPFPRESAGPPGSGARSVALSDSDLPRRPIRRAKTGTAICLPAFLRVGSLMRSAALKGPPPMDASTGEEPPRRRRWVETRGRRRLAGPVPLGGDRGGAPGPPAQHRSGAAQLPSEEPQRPGLSAASG